MKAIQVASEITHGGAGESTFSSGILFFQRISSFLNLGHLILKLKLSSHHLTCHTLTSLLSRTFCLFYAIPAVVFPTLFNGSTHLAQY